MRIFHCSGRSWGVSSAWGDGRRDGSAVARADGEYGRERLRVGVLAHVDENGIFRAVAHGEDAGEQIFFALDGDARDDFEQCANLVDL